MHPCRTQPTFSWCCVVEPTIDALTLFSWLIMIFIVFKENVMPCWATVTLAAHRSEVKPTIAASRHFATLHCKVQEKAENGQLRLWQVRLTLHSYYHYSLRSGLVQSEACRRYF